MHFNTRFVACNDWCRYYNTPEPVIEKQLEEDSLFPYMLIGERCCRVRGSCGHTALLHITWLFSFSGRCIDDQNQGPPCFSNSFGSLWNWAIDSTAIALCERLLSWPREHGRGHNAQMVPWMGLPTNMAFSWKISDRMLNLWLKLTDVHVYNMYVDALRLKTVGKLMQSGTFTSSLAWYQTWFTLVTSFVRWMVHWGWLE